MRKIIDLGVGLVATALVVTIIWSMMWIVDNSYGPNGLSGRLVPSLDYFIDQQTGVCFAQAPMGITSVPCTKEVMALVVFKSEVVWPGPDMDETPKK